MTNKDFINGLNKGNFNNFNKALEILKIDLSNYKILKVNGDEGKVITIFAIAEILKNAKKTIGYISLNSSTNINNKIVINLEPIDDDSLDFHLGCIKKLVEQYNLELSYEEAIYLVGINYFREQKLTEFIIEDIYEFTHEISGNDYLTDLTEEESNFFKKANYYKYKCELASFNYDYMDYDLPLYGAFNADYIVQTIGYINEFYPEIKRKKIKKALETIPNLGLSERVNLAPRIIIVLKESNEELIKSKFKQEFKDKEIHFITDEIINNFESDDLKEELKKLIDTYSTISLVVLIVSIDNVDKLRKIFK